MELLKLMSDRCSCRAYSTKSISEEDLSKLLEASKLAPTAHNNQPQRIYVVKSEEGKAKLMKDFKFNFNAPCYLVFGYNVDESWKNPLDNNKDSGEIDISIVMTPYNVNGRGIRFINLLDRIYRTRSYKKKFRNT
ncbi:nitroreductase family protein [Fusobacterium animalis]|nr:nitroreductase family protein [Fusobacterium animalis]